MLLPCRHCIAVKNGHLVVEHDIHFMWTKLYSLGKLTGPDFSFRVGDGEGMSPSLFWLLHVLVGFGESAWASVDTVALLLGETTRNGLEKTRV